MKRIAAIDPPSGRAGQGDHERVLRRILAGEAVDTGLPARIEAVNRIIPHNFTGGVDREVECGHPGCPNSFLVRLVPGQLVYPLWCAEHRTPHRRTLDT